MSGDLGELSDELQSLHALRRSSSGSRCIHEHHCGSQASVNSIKATKGAHSMDRGSMELPPFRGDFQSILPPLRDFNSSLRKKSWPSVKPGRMQGHHGMGDRAQGRQDRVMEEDEEEEEEDGRYDVYVRRTGSRRGNFEMAQQRSLSMDFWNGWHGKSCSSNFSTSATVWWQNSHLNITEWMCLTCLLYNKNNYKEVILNFSYSARLLLSEVGKHRVCYRAMLQELQHCRLFSDTDTTDRETLSCLRSVYVWRRMIMPCIVPVLNVFCWIHFTVKQVGFIEICFQPVFKFCKNALRGWVITF